MSIKVNGIVKSATEPINSANTDLYFNTTENILYYWDKSTESWIDLNQVILDYLDSGTTNQVLMKNSNIDFDFDWKTLEDPIHPMLLMGG
jgi:hypothetical protein